MLIARNLRLLSKITPTSVITSNFTLVRRELRRLPRHTTEYKVLNSTSLNLPKDSPLQQSSDSSFFEDGVTQEKTAEILESPKPETNRDIELKEEGGKNYVPTFNLAAYVNKSPTLQQLVHLGVDLHSIERRKGLAEFVLRLNFDENVKPYLIFLQDQGVSAETYGELITKNPLLFKIDMDDLQTRINYLEAKRFTSKQRQRILTLNPYWLMFSTKRIDRRLGHFQKEFRLSGDDVRFLASKQPRLITYNMEHVRKATFCIREEMGFDAEELKCLLLSKPRLWMMNSDELIERFAYAHQTMQLPHDMIIQFPEVLTSRVFRLRQRHEFLKMLGRAQYNTEKDLYVSPKKVVEGSDYDFARNVAKSDMQTYVLFLKTL